MLKPGIDVQFLLTSQITRRHRPLTINFIRSHHQLPFDPSASTAPPLTRFALIPQRSFLRTSYFDSRTENQRSHQPSVAITCHFQHQAQATSILSSLNTFPPTYLPANMPSRQHRHFSRQPPSPTTVILNLEPACSIYFVFCACIPHTLQTAFGFT